MTDRDLVARGLSDALLAGDWSRVAMRSRCRDALGRPRPPRWLDQLVDQVLDAYREAPADRPRELAAFLATCPAWGSAWRHRRPPRVVHWTPVPTTVVRAPWPVAELPDLGALARLLDLDQGELAWFADLRSLERTVPDRLRHYRWRVLPRPGGDVRVVAAPKPRLKEIQRRLLRHVLGPIATHEAAHGGVRGRSVRTAAQVHTGAAVVVRLDLRRFFTSVRVGRVWNLLRVAGLPEPVAHTVTGLLTTVAPTAVVTPHRVALTDGGRRPDPTRTPHLPTGAPTSTAAANLVAYALDRRLAGLAACFGARYTRYVDDLTFSGGPSLRSARSRFVAAVETIVRAEGLTVNDHKTVVLNNSGRQGLLGVVVNDHVALPRPERDALRALLHNCERYGWRTQARGREAFPAYVLGRIAWAGGLDPRFGARLRAGYDRIDWT